MPLPARRPAVTWMQGAVVALLIGAIGWLTSTVTNMYRENGATAQFREDSKRFSDARNREAEDIKTTNQLLLEHALRNCGCPGGKK